MISMVLDICMYGLIIYMYNVGQNLLTGSIFPLQMYYKHINLSYIYIYIYIYKMLVRTGL